MVNSLVASWRQPQIQSRLELYQTNLFLQTAIETPPASATESATGADLAQLRRAILGEEPIKLAENQYQAARQADQKILEDLLQQAAKQSPPANSATARAITQLQEIIPQLDIALGILQAELGNLPTAQATWQGLLESPKSPVLAPAIPPVTPETSLQATQTSTRATAEVLLYLWGDRPLDKVDPKVQGSAGINASKEPQAKPQIEEVLRSNLRGWFRDQALTQLYTKQNRLPELETLQQQRLAQARTALLQLFAITLIPATSGILGLGLLIFLGGQAIVKGKQSLLLSGVDYQLLSKDQQYLVDRPSSQFTDPDSYLTENTLSEPRAKLEQDLPAGKSNWITPWGGETIWEVLVGGFFFVGQLLIPFIFSHLPLASLSLEVRGKAIVVLATYVAMSLGTLLVLYFALRRFFPLPANWFRIDGRGRWWAWGLGGYVVAIPLVIGVSLVNQVIWQGKGGSNPILPLALQGNDLWSFLIFSTTASLAAPIFEEIIFRGFLLPSLTRYLSVGWAIVASSILFAVAHLSLSEVLPLTVLGMVLGFVYWRSQNLLASMCLHSLWNSGTLISLYILSKGAN
ncbi:MAG: CPBP family intramembrane metalloprotease [Coleofasciculaceae cyanobacterium SM2_1_6]|nr:CPBP family intramembrane metalloprotease [Coleofasciculaceae cyanobacterium SM2_1_6]